MTLTDRYVDAVIRHVPTNQREDVAADVRALVADAIEARLAASGAGDADEAVETAALEELGRPAELAANYVGTPQHLIGPGYFFPWRRLTTLLVALVAPVLAVVTAFTAWLDGEGVLQIVVHSLSSSLTVAMVMAFSITAVFAYMERKGIRLDDEDEWTVADLPAPRTANVKMSESITEVVLLAAAAAFLVWCASAPPLYRAGGVTEPILSPTLPGFVLPIVIALIGIEILSVIVRQVRGHWAIADWSVSVALNVATIAVLVPVLFAGDLLNLTAFAQIGWPNEASPFDLEQLQRIIGALVIAAGVYDIVSGYLKATAKRD